MTATDASRALIDGPWEHRMVPANGARFHVAEAGSGPLVLLLHGFPQHWWTWRHLLPDLARSGYRAAALDLRGYGASDKPPRGYDPATLAADVAGVVRSLGEPSAVLVGHGLGGLLAWTTAVAHPNVVRSIAPVAAPHPLRLRSAAARSPRQLAGSRHVLGFQLPWLPERRLTDDDAAYVEHLLRSWAGTPGYPTPDVAAVYRAGMGIPGVAHCSLEYSRWAVRSLVRPDGARYARGMREPVRVPVLQIHGGADRVSLPATARGSRAHVAAAYRFRLVPGAGHFVQEEAPDRLRDVLLEWLRDEGLSETATREPM